MSRKVLARRLVIEKAVLDVLADLNAEARDLARTEYEATDADGVLDGTTELGRVRRGRPKKSWTVTDWSAFTRWVQQNIPDGIVSQPAVMPALRTRLLKTGEWTNPVTGEILTPDGIGLHEKPGNLVVTTTDAAQDRALQLLTTVLELEQ